MTVDRSVSRLRVMEINRNGVQIIRDDRECREWLLREGVGLLSGADPKPGCSAFRSVVISTATHYALAVRFIGHVKPEGNGYMIFLIDRSTNPYQVDRTWRSILGTLGVDMDAVARGLTGTVNHLELN